MPLYGNELDRETNPFEAGLGRVVKLDKPGDFVGRAALERVARDGSREATRRARRSAAAGSPGTATRSTPATARTGVVTSGTQSPTLGKADRDGLRRPGRRRAGYDGRRRDPRSAGARRGRRPAVLPPGALSARRRRAAPVEPTRAIRAARDAPHADEEELPTMVPTDLRYTKDHEWVRVDGDEATVGITRVRRRPARRHRLRRAARRRAERSSSSRRSASSSRSRPSATCSRRSRGEVVATNDALTGVAGARQQRPVRRAAG